MPLGVASVPVMLLPRLVAKRPFNPLPVADAGQDGIMGLPATASPPGGGTGPTLGPTGEGPWFLNPGL